MTLRIWKFLTSLKVAIVLASATTLILMGGSLVMHFHPRLFGNLDQTVLRDWFRVTAGHGHLTWWLQLTGILLILLAINTCCCFLDWLVHVRQRWRKTGEYLIHLGFVLIIAAFFWGSISGFRNPDFRLAAGDTRPIPQWPGFALHLESFEPKLSERGQPLDMINQVVLLKDNVPVARATVQFNHPLTFRGLTVVPASFGEGVAGFRFLLPGSGMVTLTPGATLTLDPQKSLVVGRFYANATRSDDGRVISRGEALINPAIELELRRPGQTSWHGWYFLREGVPFPLLQEGVRLWPIEPVSHLYSQLAVNRDPGAGLALVGASAMLIGTLLALFSFYAKRSRGDRPDIP